jgi:hypothetical protein
MMVPCLTWNKEYRFIELGRKTQGLQPWDISPSPALAALAQS